MQLIGYGLLDREHMRPEEEVESQLKEISRQFVIENLNNPGDVEYDLIYRAMVNGWEVGIRQAIQYMKQRGIINEDPRK